MNWSGGNCRDREYATANSERSRVKRNRSHHSGSSYRGEWNIEDWVLLPVFIVIVPPFGFVYRKALSFHSAAKYSAQTFWFWLRTLIIDVKRTRTDIHRTPPGQNPASASSGLPD